MSWAWLTGPFGQFFLAFLVGGGAISYASFTYDIHIERRSRRLEESQKAQSLEIGRTLAHVEELLARMERMETNQLVGLMDPEKKAEIL